MNLDLSPSRNSTASNTPVDAPEGTAALPTVPSSKYTSTSTVGNDLESKIIQYYRQFNSHIHTIPGVSELSAAPIYDELNGVTGFSKRDQMIAFAGLDCSRNQSGESDKTGRMVKHGSSDLRCVLMRCADTFALHNPVVYEYKIKKMNEGKFFRVALSHVAKKLVRTIYTLEKNNLDFDRSKMR